MKAKLGKAKEQHNSSIMKEIPSVKSMQDKVRYVSPKELLYFVEEDMKLPEITSDQKKNIRLTL